MSFLVHGAQTSAEFTKIDCRRWDGVMSDTAAVNGASAVAWERDGGAARGAFPSRRGLTQLTLAAFCTSATATAGW
ncbi:hypothetical protein Q1695_008868 [Nippostrongylus brasiliensis]|nr:hypothetical protein Q1695_008868 [Nippostrongylus brasiliensis]